MIEVEAEGRHIILLARRGDRVLIHADPDRRLHLDLNRLGDPRRLVADLPRGRSRLGHRSAQPRPRVREAVVGLPGAEPDRPNKTTRSGRRLSHSPPVTQQSSQIDLLKQQDTYRLATAYTYLLGRLLHSVVNTRSLKEDEAVTVEHYRWAAELVDFGGKCLPGESADRRQFRQGLALFEGGRTLARWANDGPRTGMLIGSDIDDIRKQARAALLEALPKLRHLADPQNPPDARILQVGVGVFELYRRLAEQEILDFDQSLGNLAAGGCYMIRWLFGSMLLASLTLRPVTMALAAMAGQAP